ncbi:MAG TPA: hypothetical protein VFB99_09840, partial [Vicinamibacterales bacterium]|nr:hypothetical protein [Vicinamibacterales bacterium]
MRKGKRRSNGVRQWQTRLHLSTQAMEGDLEEARRNTAFYIGHAMDRDACANEWEWDSVRKMLAGGDYLNINRILATLASQNSAILWRNPWHRLRARRYMGSSENVEIARHVTEHTLNFCLQHPKNNWLLNSRLLVLSAELGTGIIKATYAPHEGLNPETNKREEYGEIIA